MKERVIKYAVIYPVANLMDFGMHMEKHGKKRSMKKRQVGMKKIHHSNMSLDFQKVHLYQLLQLQNPILFLNYLQGI